MWLIDPYPGLWSSLLARVGLGDRPRIGAAALEVTFDRLSGTVDGRVLTGPRAGTALSALTVAELVGFLGELAGDPGSGRLLEAYLDRRSPGWRDHAGAQSNARPGRPGRSGVMTEEQAHEVLGLQPGAQEAAIREAHRALMKRLHPDSGGSGPLAAMVNEAKDVLLKRHR